MNDPAGTTAWKATGWRSSTPRPAGRPGNPGWVELSTPDSGCPTFDATCDMQRMFASSFCAKDFPVARKRATTEQIRAMVHPIRWRIVEAVDDGPQTATTIGEALGLSSGVTSYHLRVLAEAEVIEEAPELGKGRERWWRASRPRPYVPTDAKPPEGGASPPPARLYHLERDDETLLRFMRAVRTLS